MKATEPGALRLLPPAPHVCQVCARNHAPDEPHDATTLFYRVQFRGRFGRDGTWADALAHCDAHTREVWTTQLQRIGAYTEPPEDQEPIDQPHRYGMTHVQEATS